MEDLKEKMEFPFCPAKLLGQVDMERFIEEMWDELRKIILAAG
jgi:hypothetical protein